MTRTLSLPLRLSLIAIAVFAIALPLAVLRYAPTTPAPLAVAAPRAVVARTTLPPVEPVELQALAPEDAKAFNAEVPFSTAPNPAAKPFRFRGDADDLARATDCLAAATYYEAGDDAEGEKAVAQVVLNRLRHPAFPKTVCGVVFQGSERRTGCQFTFTCDGALARVPSETAWSRARAIAAGALQGAVYKPVGYATHYHTDWVVPYWSASLDKITAVHSHLFFRWSGWWGTPPAFNRAQSGGEEPIAKLAMLSDAHRLGSALAEAGDAINDAVPFFGRLPLPLPDEANTFLTSLNPAQAGTFQSMAKAACADRPRCKFMGWSDPDQMGFRLPMTPEQMAAMSFSYIRDRSSGLDRALWNCAEFKGRSPCMKRQTPQIAAPAVATVTPPTTVNTIGPTELSGVRRKELTPAAPTAADTK